MANMAKPVFLVASFPYTRDISRPEDWDFVRRKFERDFPWLLTDEYPVMMCGVGQGWSGTRCNGRICARAGAKATENLLLDAVMAYRAHFTEGLRVAHNGLVIGIAATPESGLGLALARAIYPKKMRLVVRVQGNTSSKPLLVHQRRWRGKMLEFVESFVLKRADLVLPMGKFTKELALKRGADLSKIIPLPFPVRWADRAHVTPLPPEPAVLFAGRLEKEKGVHILLDAMAIAVKRLPQARLMVAGDGPYRPVLEAKVKQLGLCSRVSFLGWLKPERLQRAYAESWVLVLPSIWEEGLGMVLVEAGLMGRPVIGSDLGGIRDIIQHGHNGLLVPPGDAERLADAIVTVLTNPGWAWQMGQANRQVAWSYLSTRDEALERVRRAILSWVQGQ
ncbi:Alpha-D-kanosaminyltransferase [bacterium HR11]|nr:Alpha-D-kanosaminyltransferase [bacterium HR11]